MNSNLAGADGVLNVEEQMGDVKKRYGMYPQKKWNSNIAFMQFCDEKPENAT